MSIFSEIKLDIFLNLFRTEFIFRYEKIIFIGLFRRKFFISEISERVSKELTSSVINSRGWKLKNIVASLKQHTKLC